jgi:hypothetical protein
MISQWTLILIIKYAYAFSTLIGHKNNDWTFFVMNRVVQRIPSVVRSQRIKYKKENIET